MLTIKILGDVTKIVDDGILATSAAMKRAVNNTVVAVKTELRDQVRAAGFSKDPTRLANTWRSATYPRAGVGPRTLRPAGLVWSEAPAIIEAFSAGTVIRARGGGWLAIPTPQVRAMGVSRASGRSGERGMTPGRFERQTGMKLRFVYTKKRAAFLVVDGIAGRNGRGFRQATSGRQRQGRKVETFIAFVLVKQVSPRKRLDVAGVAARAGALLAANMELELGAI